MQRKIFINLLLISLIGVILATEALYAIQTLMAHNGADEIFSTRINDVEERILQNDLKIKELTEATEKDFISRARALAMMIELDPKIINDRRKLDEVAAALNVDEINIIDEYGKLWWGTQPEYYGMNFSATEQTRPFLEILENPALEIVQAPMANDSNGVIRQYAAVSLRNRKGIAQIGMAPERLATALKDNRLDSLLNDITVGNTGYIFAVEPDTGIISSHPNKELIGTSLKAPLMSVGTMVIDGQSVRYGTHNINGKVLITVIPNDELYAQRTLYSPLFMVFMLIVFGCFCVTVNAYIKRNAVNGILETVETLGKISEGNLDITANIRYNAEFKKLSDGINGMLQSIRTKMAENATLSDNLRRLGAVVASADAGISVKDKNGTVIEWNIGAENILGYTPEEIIGKTTKYYAPESYHAKIYEVERLLENGEHIAHVEVVRKHKDGRLIDCSSSYTPILDEDGNFAGSVSIFHDISDKKQIERELQKAVLAAEEANKAKSTFLANMSHEIRTPMNGIIGFVELAIDDADIPPKTREYLNTIKASSEGLLQIINAILDISKIEAGKMDLEKIPFSIVEVFKLCETVASLKAAEKGLILYCYTEQPMETNFLGDPTKLRQILINLLSNAIKFTKRGMVVLTAMPVETSPTEATILFEVKDNGIGMTEEQIKKISMPFTQADSSTTRKYGGTGLGLSISKNMIELMGGELKIESTPGIGSRFSFALTFEVAGEIKKDPVDKEVKVTELKRPTFVGDILVCEDNVINQQVIKEHLLKLGLTVTIVENGKSGIDAAQRRVAEGKAFDLILMDIHMPIMDGLVATRELIKAGIKTPIIALTANALSTDKDVYLASGMCDYLAKPFVSQDLWALLLKYLEPVELAEVVVNLETREASAEVIDRKLGINRSGDDEKFYNRLLGNFYKENQNTFQLLNVAVVTNNITHAHRIAHSLRSASGTIGATKLSQAALVLEQTLSDGELLRDPNKMSEQLSVGLKTLHRELIEVFHALKDFYVEESIPVKTGEFDKEKAVLLVDKLLPLLKSGSSKCIDYIDCIKETFSPLGGLCIDLIAQINDYDFDSALATLSDIEASVIK